MENLENTINNFLGVEPQKTYNDPKVKEVCDSQTGECYTIKEVDGIVERINKNYITEDGKTLLND